MLRVMARPSVAAISKVKTAVSGTTQARRDAPNVPHGLGLLFAGLVVDFLDERRGQGFQWPYLVLQAQVHSPPIAGCCECGDEASSCDGSEL